MRRPNVSTVQRKSEAGAGRREYTAPQEKSETDLTCGVNSGSTFPYGRQLSGAPVT